MRLALRPGRRIPTVRVFSGSLSFLPELFVRASLAALPTGTRTSLTSPRTCARLSEVWEVAERGGGRGETAVRDAEGRARGGDGRGGLARCEKSWVFSERGDKGEEREGGLRSAGEGQLR